MAGSLFPRRELFRRGAALAGPTIVGPAIVGPVIVGSFGAERLSAAPARAAAAAPLSLDTLRKEHPRLSATPGTWEAIAARRGSDPLLERFLKRSEVEARSMLTAPPVTHVLQGKRLLTQARICLRRVTHLALHAKLTQDRTLVERAAAEMAAVADFADWNPSHFLDTAEFTTALAYGYDWLYDDLDPALRAKIAGAIVTKGLRPGLAEEYNRSFSQTETNWNPVCLAGLLLGALAVAETEPVLAGQILRGVVASNPNGLKAYAPDGVYPEAGMYWAFGTTFEVVLLDALESALGSDGGLRNAPGFADSAEAVNRQMGPSGDLFNFSDCSDRLGLEPALWWFAREFDRPDLLEPWIPRLETYCGLTGIPKGDSEGNRLTPLLAIWWGGKESAATSTATSGAVRPAAGSSSAVKRASGTAALTAEATDHWLGRGPQPIAVFRGSAGKSAAAATADGRVGTPAATAGTEGRVGTPATTSETPAATSDRSRDMYLALKGGSASVNHGHMDAGSFVFEAGGVRWARDLGMQDYYSLESKNLDLWRMDQAGDRWKVFRLNNRSHNTLTIGDQLHTMAGAATIVKFSATKTPGAIVHLSPVFAGQAARVTRGFVFRDGSHVLVRDELEGVPAGRSVRWAMLTKAEIAVSDVVKNSKFASEAILSEGGKRLRVSLISAIPAKFSSISVEQPPAEFDAPNPGARMLVFEVAAPRNGQIAFSVLLEPLAEAGADKPAPDDALARLQLARWPLAAVR